LNRLYKHPLSKNSSHLENIAFLKGDRLTEVVFGRKCQLHAQTCQKGWPNQYRQFGACINQKLLAVHGMSYARQLAVVADV
jgi:hypothetical protein